MVERKLRVEELLWLREIEVIGWDLDGTLYPADAIPRVKVRDVMYQKVAEARGSSLSKAKEEFGIILGKLGSHTKTLDELGLDGAGFFTNLWDELPLEKYIKPNLELVEMMERMTRYRHFILSNSNRVDQIERKLKLIGFDPGDFEFLVSTVEVGVVKPGPEPFMECVRLLNVGRGKSIAPHQVLYVGDRESTDIVGAQGVGMRACLVGGESSLADCSRAKVHEVFGLFEE